MATVIQAQRDRRPWRIGWISLALGLASLIIPVAINLGGQPAATLAHIPPPPATNGALYALMTTAYLLIWLVVQVSGLLALLLGGAVLLRLRSEHDATIMRVGAGAGALAGGFQLLLSLLVFLALANVLILPHALWLLVILPA